MNTANRMQTAQRTHVSSAKPRNWMFSGRFACLLLLIAVAFLIQGCQPAKYAMKINRLEGMNSNQDRAVVLHLVSVNEDRLSNLKEVSAKKWFSEGFAQSSANKPHVQKLSVQKGTSTVKWPVKESLSSKNPLGYILYANYSEVDKTMTMPCRLEFKHDKRFVLAPIFSKKTLGWTIDLKNKSIASPQSSKIKE